MPWRSPLSLQCYTVMQRCALPLQIREKEVVMEGIVEAELQWPYAPTHQPNDKRPLDAVSRPQSALRGA